MSHLVGDLEAQTHQTKLESSPAIAPWEALNLEPYLSPGSGIAFEGDSTQQLDISQATALKGDSMQHITAGGHGTPPDPDAVNKLGLFLWEKSSVERVPRFERLPPVDPTHWPLHSKLFVAGFLFFPCWWYGAYRKGEDVYAEMQRFRCSAMTISSVAIIVSLLILEVGFRNV